MRRSRLKFSLALWAVVSVLLLVSLLWSAEINAQLGLVDYDKQNSSTEGIAIGASASLDVHFVDVGQGDCIIFNLPDDRIMMVDAGETGKHTKINDYIKDNIRRDGNAIDYLDIVLLTHAHEDHCGGMAGVLEKYPSKLFYRPNVKSTNSGFVDAGADQITAKTVQSSQAYRRAIEAAYNSGDVSVVKSNFTISSTSSQPDKQYTIDVFYSATNDDKTTKNHNNFSPIMTIEYQGKRFVISGDAEKEVENEYVDYMRTRVNTSTYYADVIKLGHHGSSTSSAKAYLDLLTTKSSIANSKLVIQVGEGNSYNHPTQSTLDRVLDMGFSVDSILRNDIHSDIVFSVKRDDDGVYQLFSGSQIILVENNPYVVTWQETVLVAIVVLFVVLVLPHTGLLKHSSAGKSSAGKNTKRAKGGKSTRSGGSSSKSRRR